MESAKQISKESRDKVKYDSEKFAVFRRVPFGPNKKIAPRQKEARNMSKVRKHGGTGLSKLFSKLKRKIMRTGTHLSQFTQSLAPV